MASETHIQWCHATGGPYFGCTEVSPGCLHCYARELAQGRLQSIYRKAYKAAGFTDWETRPVWGDKAPRVKSKGFWKDALALNAKAEREGTRLRWFPSMIDPFDPMPAGIIDQKGNWLNTNQVRAEFFDIIRQTPHLDWLLLTKRPELWEEVINGALMWCFHQNEGRWVDLMNWLAAWTEDRTPRDNIWIGWSVEDQPRMDERTPHGLAIPAVVRFLSMEPLLGPVEFSNVTHRSDVAERWGKPALAGIDWVIVGGESGPGARPMNIQWARSIIVQCQAAGVAPFVKQLGAKPYEISLYTRSTAEITPPGIDWVSESPELKDMARPLKLTHPKGGDPEEWPKDLRIREFPTVPEKL